MCTTPHLFGGVDESALTQTDRLGLAWCRLNCDIWDDIVGEKPVGFDELPRFDDRRFRVFRKKMATKHDYVHPAMVDIELEIGHKSVSRCWWLFALKKTEEEWHQWYDRLGLRKMP